MSVRFTVDYFWDRYGHTDLAATDFMQALDRLPDVRTDGPWVAGGSVRRLVARQSQDSDFDFFFKDEAQFNAFCEGMTAKGAVRMNENEFNVTFRLPAKEPEPIDLDEFTPGGPELKVQAIRIAFFPDMESVVESFDFSICQFAFDGEDFVTGDFSLFDLASKRLVPGQIRYGTSSLRRIIKYTRQGFTICGGGLANILQQIVDDPSIIQSDVEYID